jgi:lipopolysaccharide biosynthesis protein
MKRTIVIAHFDPDGRIDDYVVDALHRYRNVASEVILVSASTADLPGHVRSLVDTFIPRENVGYDFCSWRAGIESIRSLDGIDELICVNDSVYGPVGDLGPALDDARVAKADAWGMCLSVQGTAVRGHAPTPHIQSWFVAMRRLVLQSSAFRSFWGSVTPLPTKADVIEQYELGLSMCLRDAGFTLAGIHDATCAPPISWPELLPMLSPLRPSRSWGLLRRAHRGAHRHNPAELRPIRLLEDGVPFIKSSIFRVNHYRLNLGNVRRALGRRTAYDVGMMERHHARMRRNRAMWIGG